MNQRVPLAPLSRTVTLTWRQVAIAYYIAGQRQIENMARGRQHKYGASDDNSFDMHVTGVCAEMATAKLLDRFYCGNLGNLDADDVGDLQVRYTEYENGRLILHPDDPDDRYFILVTGKIPTFVIHGYMMARDGKQQCFWKDPSRQNRWAFFIPQSSLIPIAQLMRAA